VSTSEPPAAVDHFLTGLTWYYWTGLVVLLGLSFGRERLAPSSVRGETYQYAGEAYANWDGQWYKRIAAEGYSYRPGQHSSIAFFPAYPLLGAAVARLAGCRPEIGLAWVSNGFCLALFGLMSAYATIRRPDPSGDLATNTVLALALAPPSFFLRMAYSESMFLTLAVLVLIGAARKWHPAVLAALIGVATATRAVGIALIPALVLTTWRRDPRPIRAALRSACLLPLSCWGMAVFMAYQYAAFGDPLAFLHAQASWRLHPVAGTARRVLDLATFEPIRTLLLDPSAPGFWTKLAATDDPVLSLRAADPFYFGGALALLVLGGIRRWLNAEELACGAALLLIPYATIGYEQYMQSMARYSTAALPVYLVLGEILSKMPRSVVLGITALAGFGLGLYTALFAAWYVFI
jgi:hypothetical protein